MVEKYTLNDYTKGFRPFPGGAISAYELTVVAAGETVIIGPIAGKGSILGGIFTESTPNASWDSWLALIIDGEETTASSYTGLDLYNIVPPAGYLVRLLTFDIATPVYALDILPGISFEESLAFKYKNEGLGPTAVYLNLVYYLMG